MREHDNNKKSATQANIEKYDFDCWEKEHLPYVMIPTHVIQYTPPRHIDAVFMWIYFQSLPPDWKINKQHILEHFAISPRSYERRMAWLKRAQLVEYRHERTENGQFKQWRLIILNGTKFIPNIDDDHSVNNGDLDDTHSANLPRSGSATAMAGDAHTNTIYNTNTRIDNKKDNKKEKINKKEKEARKKNIPPPFSSADKKSDNPGYQETLYRRDSRAAPIAEQLAESATYAHYQATEQDMAKFETFWALYPLQSAKPRTQALWFEQGCHFIADAIIAKLKEQIARDRRFLQGYPFNSVNYLLNREWESAIFEQQQKSALTYADGYDRDSIDWIKDLHTPLGGHSGSVAQSPTREQKFLTVREMLALKPEGMDF